MSLNIELLCSNRERALSGCPEASATFTFTISDGPFKARAEVMLTDLPQFCLSRKFFEHNRMHGNAASSFVCG